MNIQLKDIVQSEEVLMRLFQTRPAKAKDTFRLAQLKRVLAPIFEDYFEARTKLLDKHAHPDEIEGHYLFVKMDAEGNPLLDAKDNLQKNDEAIEAFDQALGELLDEEVEVLVKPLTLAIIDSIGLEPALSVAEMETVFWLIKESVT